MKKFLALVMAMMMVLSLAACGSTDGDVYSADPDTNVTTNA